MMANRKRYDTKAKEYSDNAKIDAFIDEITAVCKKHGLSISHEDHHGSFVIESYDDDNIQWLDNASVGEI